MNDSISFYYFSSLHFNNRIKNSKNNITDKNENETHFKGNLFH